MKVLIDTNVILDFFLRRAEHYEKARRIFELTTLEKITACTTASSITDIYYIVAKRLGDQAARGALKNLFSLFTVIAVDGDDCINALDLPVSDYEDAVVTVCTGKEGVDVVITNDAEFQNIDPALARVVAPGDFLEMF